MRPVQRPRNIGYEIVDGTLDSPRTLYPGDAGVLAVERSGEAFGKGLFKVLYQYS